AFPRLVLALTLCTTVHYATWVSIALLRGRLAGPSVLRGALMATVDGSVILLIALARHVAVLWSPRLGPPTRGWLAVNYGPCGTALALAVAADVFVTTVPGWQAYSAFSLYLLGLGIAIVWDFRRGAARGSWRAGVLWQARTADVVAIGI